MAWAVAGRTAVAQEESALLEEVQGGMRGAAERMSQSASAAAARKLCQMGMIRGAVAEDREGSRPEALPARWRSVIRTQSSARAGTDQTNSDFILSIQYLWRVRETVEEMRDVEETYT